MDRWTVKVITVLDLMSMRIQKQLRGLLTTCSRSDYALASRSGTGVNR